MAVVASATITLSDSLGITFQFSTERIRSVAQLHKFSIPGRIKTDRREEYQSTGVVGSLPQLRLLDKTEHHGVYNHGEVGSLPTKA